MENTYEKDYLDVYLSSLEHLKLIFKQIEEKNKEYDTAKSIRIFVNTRRKIYLELAKALTILKYQLDDENEKYKTEEKIFQWLFDSLKKLSNFVLKNYCNLLNYNLTKMFQLELPNQLREFNVASDNVMLEIQNIFSDYQKKKEKYIEIVALSESLIHLKEISDDKFMYIAPLIINTMIDKLKEFLKVDDTLAMRILYENIKNFLEFETISD